MVREILKDAHIEFEVFIEDGVLKMMLTLESSTSKTKKGSSNI